MIKLLFSKEHRNFSRLWLAQLISQFGDRVHQFALVALIAERSPGSAVALAKLMSFTIMPVFIVQPFAGVLVDRWDRRTTLFVCDILRGVLVIFIPFVFIHWESIVPIYIIVFLAFCFSRFYVPAKMSIIPDLVEEDNLLMANSLVTTTGMIALVLGCSVGAIMVEFFGAKNGFYIDALTFFLSGAIVFSINIPKKITESIKKTKILEKSREIVGTIGKPIWLEIKEGTLYLFKHKEIRLVVDMLFVLLSAAGAVYVVIIVFIQESFQSVAIDLGLLVICLGVGLFLGVMAYGRWGKRFVWYKTIFFCLISGGIMLVIFAWLVHVNPSLIMAMFVSGILGLVIGPIFISSNTMVHLVCHDEMRGKVFSSLEIVIHFAFLAAMLISSWLSQYIERVYILVSVGVLFSVIGLYGFTRVKKDKILAMSGEDMA